MNTEQKLALIKENLAEVTALWRKTGFTLLKLTKLPGALTRDYRQCVQRGTRSKNLLGYSDDRQTSLWILRAGNEDSAVLRGWLSREDLTGRHVCIVAAS